MTGMLNISTGRPRLTLPIDAVTETFGILAKRGAGKSNAAVVMAEEMWDAGVPWVAIDPKGDWWGMRSSGDGTEPGLPLVVFGGRHGDLPLEPTAGPLIADLILEHRLTCILDVSEFSKADTRRFLLAFAERLYRQATDEPLHLFLEEAHEYLPQRVTAGDAPLVGAWQRIVKAGRFKGFGCTLITQRSAALNKDVLTQVDTLIMLRTTSPQDRAAVKAWVDVHADSDEVIDELPMLADGEAWVWSPEFLKQLVKITFRRRRTYDSGATPKVGQSKRPPATLADVDLGAIKDAMAETIEKAAENDPKVLKRRIAELERQLATVVPEVQVREVEVPVLPPFHDRQLDTLADIEARMNDLHVDLDELISEMRRDANNMPAVMGRSDDPPIELTVHLPPPPAPKVSDVPLSKPERAILSVLAQHPAGRSRVQLALLTGYSVKSSSLSNALGSLRSNGYVTKGGEPIQVTEAGIDVIGDHFEPLPSGEALYGYWRQRLGKAERIILDAFVHAYPATLDRDQLSIVTGYSATSSSLSNALGKLRSLELVDGWGLHPDFAEATR